jgi:hypothetical protein
LVDWQLIIVHLFIAARDEVGRSWIVDSTVQISVMQ